MTDFKEYPKARIELKQFIKQLIEGFQTKAVADLPSKDGVEIPTLEDTLLEKMTDQFLVLNPRSLTDFFDKYKIYIEIKVDRSSVDGVKFFYSLGGSSSEMFNTRGEAEAASYKFAINKLEQILN
jgi:hypothetical protein